MRRQAPASRRIAEILEDWHPENVRSLEDCFLQDPTNEGCWSILQVLVDRELGVGYTINMTDSCGNLEVRYTYAKPRSFFTYGPDSEHYWDFGVRRNRVEDAVKNVPTSRDDIFDTQEDLIQANMYQYRGKGRDRNVHTLACCWSASTIVRDELSPFRNMKVYFCLDWDSLGGRVPPPHWDDRKLYQMLEF